MPTMNLFGYVILLTHVKSIVGIDPKVLFPNGSLIGKYFFTRGGRQVQGFLGIPYAEPPVGDLRFQPPQPEDLVQGYMLAQTMPNPCSQPSNVSPDSEDCLYLNVFTPNATADPPLPVYVYIFGGKYSRGDLSGYTPEYLLDEDVVLITIQYRLALFGFLTTGDGVIPGNMGLKDVRCALRWVRDNIWRFGGDPDKVTLGGNSSGGSMVHTLMTYCGHEGLFRAGISESGTALTSTIFVSPQEIEWIVDVIANLSSCPADSIGFANCLRNKTAKNLVDYYEILVGMDNNPLELFEFYKECPAVGTVVEPTCVKDRLVTGNPWYYNTSLPYMVGVNSKEYLPGFFSEMNISTLPDFPLFNSLFDVGFPLSLKYEYSSANGSLVPLEFRHFYLDNDAFSTFNLANGTDGISDAFVLYPSFEAAMRATNPNAFFYYFDYNGTNTDFPIPPEYRIGAVHVDELFYIFPVTFGTHYPPTETDICISKILVKLWANFITHLDPTPNSTQGLNWLPFHSNQSYLHIKQDGMETKPMLFRERMDFWKSQPYPFRDDPDDEVPCSPIQRRNDF